MFEKTLLLFQAETDIERSTGSQSFLDIITQGGPLGILIVLVLFVLSVIALYIFVERYLTIKRAARIDESFMNNIRANVSTGNILGAKALCQSTDSPVARMVEKGLQRIGKPLRDIDAAIENVGNLENFQTGKESFYPGKYCRCCSDDRIFWNGNRDDPGLLQNGYRTECDSGRTGRWYLSGPDHNCIWIVYWYPGFCGLTIFWWPMWKRSYIKWSGQLWTSWIFSRNQPDKQ